MLSAILGMPSLYFGIATVLKSYILAHVLQWYISKEKPNYSIADSTRNTTPMGCQKSEAMI